MQRYCFLIHLKTETAHAYLSEHQHVWPEVLAQISRSNIRNYSIFLRRPEHLLIGYYEYHGSDHAADLKAMGEDETTQKWWALCKPMQAPLDTREPDDWWAPTELVFQLEEQLAR